MKPPLQQDSHNIENQGNSQKNIAQRKGDNEISHICVIHDRSCHDICFIGNSAAYHGNRSNLGESPSKPEKISGKKLIAAFVDEKEEEFEPSKSKSPGSFPYTRRYGGNIGFHISDNQRSDEDDLGDYHTLYGIEKMKMPQRPYSAEKQIADQAADNRGQTHHSTVYGNKNAFSPKNTASQKCAHRGSQKQGKNGAGKPHPQSYGDNVHQFIVSG